MTVFHVVGARPNFVKLAPLFQSLSLYGVAKNLIVHTGQHYDYEMSQIFFKSFELPAPDHYLGVGSGPHGLQTGRIMIAFEKLLLSDVPDIVVVYGDVNSTLACSITAKKIGIPIAHVEAGLRSFDMSMPEEINRKLTDSISDLLFTPSTDADVNLMNEGIDENKICLVGNIMIDSLIAMLKKISGSYEKNLLSGFGLQRGSYMLCTLHRPSNVDTEEKLSRVLGELEKISEQLPVIFPVHPRTRKKIRQLNTPVVRYKGLVFLEPQGYKEFIALEKNACGVITDSGGIQEETTFLGIPCLTLRSNTERPITVNEGTNELVEVDMLAAKVKKILCREWKKGKRPELWDGLTAERISKKIIDC